MARHGALLLLLLAAGCQLGAAGAERDSGAGGLLVPVPGSRRLSQLAVPRTPPRLNSSGPLGATAAAPAGAGDAGVQGPAAGAALAADCSNPAVAEESGPLRPAADADIIVSGPIVVGLGQGSSCWQRAGWHAVCPMSDVLPHAAL